MCARVCVCVSEKETERQRESFCCCVERKDDESHECAGDGSVEGPATRVYRKLHWWHEEVKKKKNAREERDELAVPSTSFFSLSLRVIVCREFQKRWAAVNSSAFEGFLIDYSNFYTNFSISTTIFVIRTYSANT